QVEGVPEHQLVAEIPDLAGREPPHARLGRQRDECRGRHVAVRGAQDPRTSVAVAGADVEAEPGRVLSHRPSLGRYFGWPVPSTAPVSISTRVGSTSAGLGIRTSSTPSRNLAATRSESTP